MNELSQADSIFSIHAEEDELLRSNLLSYLAVPVEFLSGLHQLKKLYQRIERLSDPRTFLRRSLAELHITPVFNDRDRLKIPSKGPCVVISNHPFGALEGMVLTEMLLGIRPDVKMMVNFLLARIPQLRGLMISVDPFEGKNSASANIRPVREALRWVREGGLLVVFPAGEVSQYRISHRTVADPPWKYSVATIIRHTKPIIIPIFFQGRNSLLFQMAGLVHPRLRTLLLARELLGKQGKKIHFKIGNPISYQSISHYSTDNQLLDYLRWRTYIMGHTHRQGLIRKLPAAVGAIAKRRKPLAKPQSPEVCRREIETLPQGQKLVQSGPLSVWQARSEQIPHILMEIGRLRELSFRLAGEGTNQPLDIDRFDAHYLHLFIWHEETNEIVGAYRIGQIDRIVETIGKKGLYTDTLFQSRVDFYDKLGPALELGRSFITPEYQKTYLPLLLLWKGIGAFIARHPQHHLLFGAVSISSDYSDLSRRLLATTLMRHANASDLAVMVKPRRPISLKTVRIRGCDDITPHVKFQNFKEICAVVSDIEVRFNNVPVLLRQYLNLGGQLLAFNIDKSFGGVMDGLIVVDLLKTNSKTLERYMGKDGANHFLSYHSDRMEQHLA